MVIGDREYGEIMTPSLGKSQGQEIINWPETKKPNFGTGFKPGLLAQEAIAQPRAPTTRQKCIS